ncbi:MFS transporter [Micromonospora cathayae]|uniref:MFS transporter n=1 Tax=Micromonospora cathayae TaxID=3028804 RepID=A0ABY7ZHF4_9ACTN|nr:MFS transporter [Micromonospora sp. HUAS 3]WDZ82305.1 MFS transporter [Micromonospora sp. HUAS 3]
MVQAAVPEGDQMLSRGRVALLLAITCGAQLLVIFDETVVNLALPSIRTDLEFSTSSLAWVVDAYMLLFGGFLLLGGRGADLFGRQRMFLVGLTVFVGASLAGGLAQSDEALIIARGVQGFGAALLSPAALSILVSAFTHADQRGKALGVWGGLSGIAGTTGVLLGGLITDTIGWRWVFFINVPVGALLFALTVAGLRGRSADIETVGGPRRLDGFGAATITGGLLLLVYTMLNTSHRDWSDPLTIGGLAGAALLIGLFVWWEGRAPEPLLRLGILANRQIAVANILTVLAASALYGTFFFLSLYMQVINGWSPIRAGLSWAPLGLTMAVFAGAAMQLTPKLGTRNLIMVGLALVGVGQLLLLRSTVGGSYVSELLPTLLLSGAGFGLALVPLVVAAVSGVAREESGIASGLMNTSQQVGGAVGLAVLVTVANEALSGKISEGVAQGSALLDGLHAAFLVAAILTAVAVLVTFVLPNNRAKVDMAAIHGG